ncbi:peptidyl-prolyl cis-trans isomerase [Candidatus Dependentiae bacterium]
MKGKYFLVALAPVLLLSGCKWFAGGAKEEKKSPVAMIKTAKDLPTGVLAVWADGSTVLTQNEFDEVLEMVMREQPELQGLAEAFMPMLKQNLFNSLIQNKIIAKWVAENDIDRSSAYKSKLKQMRKAIEQKVNLDFFAEQFKSAITEKDKKDYYEKNKDRVALVTKGGVKAAGVKFDTEAGAKVFLAKAKGGDFDKLASADEKLKKNMQDFLYVSADSRQIDKKIIDAVLALKTFPSVIMVKVDGKTFWVVNATEKKKTQYRSYDELKDQIENVVKQTKQGEAAMKKLQELQKKYGLKIKEGAMAPKKAPMPAQMKPAPKAPKKGKGKAVPPKPRKKATKAA